MTPPAIRHTELVQLDIRKLSTACPLRYDAEAKNRRATTWPSWFTLPLVKSSSTPGSNCVNSDISHTIEAIKTVETALRPFISAKAAEGSL
jgi:hypothetical protein